MFSFEFNAKKSSKKLKKVAKKNCLHESNSTSLHMHRLINSFLTFYYRQNMSKRIEFMLRKT